MREKNVEPFIGTDGRMKVELIDKNGISRIEDLARLVAISFPEIVGTPKEGFPMFKDGNFKNCSAANLYWK